MSRVVYVASALLVVVVVLFVKGTVVTPGASVPPLLALKLTALEPVLLVPTGVKISGASSTDEICLSSK